MNDTSSKPQKVIDSVYEALGMLYLICESAFYPGAGREFAQVDLPVQRNIMGIPNCQSTTIKGALRNMLENQNTADVNIIFGNENRTGAISFDNAEILLFPVRSNVELFWYITSPSQLSMWIRKIDFLGRANKIKDAFESIMNKLKDRRLGLVSNETPYDGKKIILLDDVILELKSVEELKSITEEIEKAMPDIPGYSYIKRKIRSNVIVVCDEIFKLLTNKGLYRIARIRLKKETKTVEEGALFFQELIPEYTILFTLILKAYRYRNDAQTQASIKNFVTWLMRNPLVCIAGDETTGRGQIRLCLVQ